VIGSRHALGALIGTFSALLILGCGSTSARRAPGQLVPIGAGIDGPPGLRATVYAKGVPTVATFAGDPQGRLWAAAAGLTNHRYDGVYLITKPGATPLHVISGLDDPLGLLWYRSRLYVSSLGRVTVFSHFNGTRFTTHAIVLRGPVQGGENNDLVLAPNGRLLMGITATCDACLPHSRFSGSIVSFRPDGTDLRVYAARIRAPVGLAFYPGTSELFVTMNQRNDLGALTTGDALAVVKPSTNWGFPGCYQQGGSACAGVPKPVALLDKHAAVGSVAIVTGELGHATGTAALVAEWQTAKVQRVALSKTGGTVTGSVSPWLTGPRNPLALITRRGSVLVGDWGTGTIYQVTAASRR
jgi:glucose/arabinose dehydrogenase